MTRRQPKLDKETSWGMLLVVFSLIATVALGAAIRYWWHDDERKAEARQSRYLSLGEHRLAIGRNSMLVQFSVEYVGADTGAALEKAQPRMQNEVLKLLHGSDVARLRTPQGKIDLAGHVLEVVRTFVPEEDARSVKEVLYQKFLIGE